jgi:hypothetical protein
MFKAGGTYNNQRALGGYTITQIETSDDRRTYIQTRRLMGGSYELRR